MPPASAVAPLQAFGMPGLGADIDITSGDFSVAAVGGTDFGIAASSDLAVLAGYATAAARIARRIADPVLSLLGDTTWGCGAGAAIGYPLTPTLQSQISGAVQTGVVRDPSVLSVSGVSVSADGSDLLVSATALLAGAVALTVPVRFGAAGTVVVGRPSIVGGGA